MTDGLKDAHREAIIAALAANDRVERAVLFGSRATGTNTVTSDVDIALFGDRLTLTDQARLAAAVEEIPMAQSVDLMLYDSVRDRTLRAHIRNDGVEWFTRAHRVACEIRSDEILDWRETTLGQLGRIVTGRTPPSGHPEYFNGHIPFVTPTDFDGRRWIDVTKRYLTRAGADMVSGARVHDEAVMVSCIGSDMGKAAVASRACVTNQQINSLIINVNSDDSPLFVYYNLRSRREQIRGSAGGSAQPILNKSAFSRLPIRLPAAPEQRAIAHVLGTLDDKIELNRRMNGMLEGMARALFKSWFVDFDPVRAKMEGRDTGLPQDIADLFPDRLVDSEMGEIPEGWEIYSLGRLADHHTKSTSPLRSPDEEYEHFSIPAYDVGQCPSIEPGAAIRSNKTVVRRDAVLLSKLNPRIPRVWVPADTKGRPQVCSTEFLVFTPRPPANRSLLFALFSDQSFRALLKSMVTGTSKSHQRVPPKALKTQEVLTGSPRVFQVFGVAVTSMLAGVLRNRSEATTLAALRDTLLPKLISGEIRIPDAERALESVP